MSWCETSVARILEECSSFRLLLTVADPEGGGGDVRPS